MIEGFRKRPAGAALLAFAAVLGVSALAAPYTVDDAFIVARYAQNLARGAGYAMNPGVPSDGVTGPLWLAPACIASWLGLDPIVASKVLGALCAALASLGAASWAGWRALGMRASWGAALALASLPDVATWSVSGLETGAALLAVTLLAFALLARDRPRWIAAAIASAAIAWLRPELALCAGVLWLARIARAPRAAAPWAALAMLLALSVVGFRLALFGHVLPLSASAKPADLMQGASYALRGLLLMTSLAGAALAVLGAAWGRREDRWLLATVAAHFVAVALAGGDWMPGARLLVPIAALYALLLGRGFALLALRRRRIALLGLAFSLSVPLVDLAVRVPQLRANAAQRAHGAAQLAGRLREIGGVVALLDVGYLGYASGLSVVDLGGLTDPHIAALPGGHIDKRVDEAYLRGRDPRVIVLHSSEPPRMDSENRLVAFAGYPVEQRVAAMPWAREAFRVSEYVRLNASYGYIVLVRIER